MKTKIVEFQDDEFKARIVIRRGSLLENLVVEQLRQQALKSAASPLPAEPVKAGDSVSGAPEPSPVDQYANARQTVEIVVWPVISVCTEECVICNPAGETLATWPFDLDQFIALYLTQELVDAWLDAIWSLNKSWKPKTPRSDKESQAEKKD